MDLGEDPIEVVERRHGRCGELVLRRRGGDWEVVCDGTFLIASCNEDSSRAMIAAAAPLLPDRSLDVLIGGLGMGYALDEALGLTNLGGVIVAEREPVVVEWWQRHFGERACRALADPRCQVVEADVFDLLGSPAVRYDLVALDTDNGPLWLVDGDNARIYDDAGLRRVAVALRPGGVVVFWSPDRYPEFERRLRAAFSRVIPSPATDVVGRRRFEYTMYVCARARPG